MNIRIRRQGASPFEANDDSLTPSILAVAEYLTPARTASPDATRTGRARLRPGNIYRLYTGISIDEVTLPWQLHAQADKKFFAEGLQVVRVDVQPEICFYVTVMQECAINISEQVVQLWVADSRKADAPGAATVERAAELPGIGYRPSTGKERYIAEVPNSTAAATAGQSTSRTDKEAEKKGDEWLASDDTRGSVVGTDTAPGAGSPSLATGAVTPVTSTYG